METGNRKKLGENMKQLNVIVVFFVMLLLMGLVHAQAPAGPSDDEIRNIVGDTLDKTLTTVEYEGLVDLIYELALVKGGMDKLIDILRYDPVNRLRDKLTEFHGGDKANAQEALDKRFAADGKIVSASSADVVLEVKFPPEMVEFLNDKTKSPGLPSVFYKRVGSVGRGTVFDEVLSEEGSTKYVDLNDGGKILGDKFVVKTTIPVTSVGEYEFWGVQSGEWDTDTLTLTIAPGGEYRNSLLYDTPVYTSQEVRVVVRDAGTSKVVPELSRDARLSIFELSDSGAFEELHTDVEFSENGVYEVVLDLGKTYKFEGGLLRNSESEQNYVEATTVVLNHVAVPGKVANVFLEYPEKPRNIELIEVKALDARTVIAEFTESVEGVIDPTKDTFTITKKDAGKLVIEEKNVEGGFVMIKTDSMEGGATYILEIDNPAEGLRFGPYEFTGRSDTTSGNDDWQSALVEEHDDPNDNEYHRYKWQIKVEPEAKTYHVVRGDSVTVTPETQLIENLPNAINWRWTVQRDDATEPSDVESGNLVKDVTQAGSSPGPLAATFTADDVGHTLTYRLTVDTEFEGLWQEERSALGRTFTFGDKTKDVEGTITETLFVGEWVYIVRENDVEIGEKRDTLNKHLQEGDAYLETVTEALVDAPLLLKAGSHSEAEALTETARQNLDLAKAEYEAARVIAEGIGDRRGVRLADRGLLSVTRENSNVVDLGGQVLALEDEEVVGIDSIDFNLNPSEEGGGPIEVSAGDVASIELDSMELDQPRDKDEVELRWRLSHNDGSPIRGVPNPRQRSLLADNTLDVGGTHDATFDDKADYNVVIKKASTITLDVYDTVFDTVIGTYTWDVVISDVNAGDLPVFVFSHAPGSTIVPEGQRFKITIEPPADAPINKRLLLRWEQSLPERQFAQALSLKGRVNPAALSFSVNGEQDEISVVTMTVVDKVKGVDLRTYSWTVLEKGGAVIKVEKEDLVLNEDGLEAWVEGNIGGPAVKREYFWSIDPAWVSGGTPIDDDIDGGADAGDKKSPFSIGPADDEDTYTVSVRIYLGEDRTEIEPLTDEPFLTLTKEVKVMKSKYENGAVTIKELDAIGSKIKEKMDQLFIGELAPALDKVKEELEAFRPNVDRITDNALKSVAQSKYATYLDDVGQAINEIPRKTGKKWNPEEPRTHQKTELTFKIESNGHPAANIDFGTGKNQFTIEPDGNPADFKVDKNTIVAKKAGTHKINVIIHGDNGRKYRKQIELKVLKVSAKMKKGPSHVNQEEKFTVEIEKEPANVPLILEIKYDKTVGGKGSLKMAFNAAKTKVTTKMPADAKPGEYVYVLRRSNTEGKGVLLQGKVTVLKKGDPKPKPVKKKKKGGPKKKGGVSSVDPERTLKFRGRDVGHSGEDFLGPDVPDVILDTETGEWKRIDGYLFERDFGILEGGAIAAQLEHGEPIVFSEKEDLEKVTETLKRKGYNLDEITRDDLAKEDVAWILDGDETRVFVRVSEEDQIDDWFRQHSWYEVAPDEFEVEGRRRALPVDLAGVIQNVAWDLS